MEIIQGRSVLFSAKGVGAFPFKEGNVLRRNWLNFGYYTLSVYCKLKFSLNVPILRVKILISTVIPLD